MARTPTFCVVTLLVMALSIASAGAFACQIDCAVSSAPTPMSHAGSCGGHPHVPSHASGGHPHSGHTHSRIIAAAHSGFQQTTLHQTGLVQNVSGGVSALAGATHTQGSRIAAAKSPGLIFTTPVLRL